ncbi:MAG: GNAT family N-acetyltransferase [bacterium]|nr:GNAT family N-acetyltransferase [bacterium]MDW8105709.1 GNAT family N-acetyltransferase [Armatimonadota bacterium]
MNIRPAREEDAPALARLYVEAFGSKLRWAFGQYEQALPVVVEQLLQQDQMRLSETLVAEVNGEIAGMAVLRRDPRHRPHWVTIWRLIRRHVRGWRMFTATFIMTAMCNNLCTPTRSYLESLAVDARYRGQGIGTLLLERCFEESRRAGKREISLHVVDTNPRAKQLYERMGFRTVRVERFGRIAARWMGFSAQDFMVRPLSSSS